MSESKNMNIESINYGQYRAIERLGIFASDLTESEKALAIFVICEADPESRRGLTLAKVQAGIDALEDLSMQEIHAIVQDVTAALHKIKEAEFEVEADTKN